MTATRGVQQDGLVLDRVVLCGNVVRLDPMEPADVDNLLAAASEDRTTFSFTRVPADRAEMVDYVAAALDDERRGSALPFTIRVRANDTVVGTTRFMDIEYWSPGDAAPSGVEIGSTWLATSAQRTAVNTECKLLLLAHAFEVWAVQRVTFKTDARNTRSRNAIQRIGATYEGIRRAHTLASDGSVRDSAYFSIVAAEWPEVKAGLYERAAGLKR